MLLVTLPQAVSCSLAVGQALLPMLLLKGTFAGPPWWGRCSGVLLRVFFFLPASISDYSLGGGGGDLKNCSLLAVHANAWT